METKTFNYKIFFRSSGFQFDYSVELSSGNFEHPAPTNSPPDWCKLAFKKCPNCTLDSAEHEYCPLATRLIPFVELPKCNSYDDVNAEVEFDDRTMIYQTSAQEAFSSLLGLVMATSGCPHMAFFKPMAWYHQPFSNSDETMFRVCTTYLFSYFIHRAKAEEVSFDFLKRVHENIHIINVNIAARVQNYLSSDSAVNAIVLLDLITNDLPIAIEEDLNELKQLFNTHNPIFQEPS